MAWTTAELKDLVRRAAAKYGIDEAIALAQIQQESSFNPNVCSGAGACGIAQFMPATAKRFGLVDRRDPVASLEAWGKYMTVLLKMFDHRYDLALAGYNWGENRTALKTALRTGQPLKGQPEETRNYVVRILSRAGKDDGALTPVPLPFSPTRTIPNALIFIIAAIALLAVSGSDKRGS